MDALSKAEAVHCQAVEHASGKREQEAEEAFRDALRLCPDFAQARNNFGVFLQERGRFEEAVEQLRRAVELSPRSVDAHNNLGVALAGMRRTEEAVDAYRQSLRLGPRFALALNNLGNALRQLERLDEAEALLTKALRINSQYAEAWNNLGIVCVDQGKLPEALANYQKAIDLKPDYVEAHANRAFSLLAAGDFDCGWVEYEWRWKSKEVNARQYSQPEWDGSSFEGKTLLVYHEQGLGDTLQFVRYLPLARRRGGNVVLECPRSLIPLLSRSWGLGRLVPVGELPPFDTHLPLMSLPRVFGTTATTIPADVPYLIADPALMDKWGRALQGYPGYRVGIAWQGSDRYRGDRQRSIPLVHFGWLASIPGVRLVSLQKGPGREQLLTAGSYFPVIDLGGMLDESTGAFVETAAVMKTLDLVITSDTAIAHLAGGLGVPVWLAIPFAPDWRWQRDREDSPWYPSMRLFRQKTAGDWEEVFSQIASRLCERLGIKAVPVSTSAALREAERLHQQAISRIEKDDLPGAVPLFREAIRLAPKNAGYHQNLGVALARQGKLEEAVASFRQTIKLAPTATEAEHNLALALLNLGECKEAADLFQRAIARQPDNADFHNNLGVALDRLALRADAITHLEEAIRLRPGFVEAQENLANCRRNGVAGGPCPPPPYRPEIFEAGSLEEAKRIVVTPEPGTTSDERWQKETRFLVEDIGKHLELNAESCVLDYGCGPGRVAKALIEAYSCQVVAVDSSESMRRLAPEYVSSERFTVYSPEDFEQKVSQGLRVDRAICLWVIQHVHDPSKVIDELKRAISPDGLLYVLNQRTRCVPTENGWYDDHLDVRVLLRQAFDELQFHQLPSEVTTPQLADASMIQILRAR